MTLAQIDAAIAAAKTMPPRARWALIGPLLSMRIKAAKREKSHG